ncbi:MAG TPA: DinB family protein [Candidatus Dormibacteraeota bacterium]|nr:DinB family protein [Candidatus Dormibacteraeota bacterium]
MAEDRDDLLRHYRQMGDELLAAIDGLSDEQMSERSIDGWSVIDHLAHLTLWDEARATEVARISAGHESAYRMSEEQDAAYNGLGFDLRRGWSPAQARWELETTRARLLEAIAAATPRAFDPSHYGEASLRSTHVGQHAKWIRSWREQQGI